MSASQVLNALTY